MKYTDKQIIDIAKDVLDIEANSINNLTNYIDTNFVEAVRAILNTKGKIFLSGVGKSGLIARKITATLSSTGTPAFYIDTTDSFHGDIGVVSKDDLGILFSFSGETEELVRLIPVLKRMQIKFIGVSGKKDSTLLAEADYKIFTPIQKEACPMGIVPTSSTTANLAIGDAIAVSLLKMRGFKEEDFARLHPGGTLGAKLLTRVSDLMSKTIPLTNSNTIMKDAIVDMTKGGLGTIGIIDDTQKLLGIITDGDLRRHINDSNFLNKQVLEIMSKNPKTISENTLAVDALNMMEKYKITQLFVCDEYAVPKGVLHIHHLIDARIT